MYGETDKILTNDGGIIHKKIQIILQKLWDNGILYRDVTPYNFLISNDGEIYIVDFEHAILLTESKKEKYLSDRKFVQGFIKGAIKNWNRNFK
jgi:RIO-like serine/threonine protein kinase